MRKNALALVVVMSGFLAGCAAQLQYAKEFHAQNTLPNQPLIAVGRFEDTRKSKTLGMLSATYRLEPKGDVGAAVQDQVAKTLYESNFNVVLTGETQADQKNLRSILEDTGADLAMSGTIRNFQVRGQGSMSSVDVIGRLNITTLARGEEGPKEREVLVTGSRRMGMLFYFGSKNHSGFDELYRRAVEIVAVGIAEDPDIKLELEKVTGEKRP